MVRAVDRERADLIVDMQENMGASIETVHLQAALVERARQLGQCEVIQ